MKEASGKTEIEKDKGSSGRIFRWLWSCYGRALGGILWVSLTGAILSVNSVISALIYKQIIDGASERSRELFLSAVISYIVLIAFNTLVRIVRYAVNERIGYGLEQKLKERLYGSVMRADYGQLSSWRTGELLNHFGGDVGIIVNALMSIVPGLISLAIRLFGAMLVLALWDWRFCLLYVAAGLISAAVSGTLRRVMKRLQKNVREEYDGLYSFMQETLENVVMIRAFRAEERALGRLSGKLNELKLVRRRQNRFSNFCNTGLSCLMNVGYLFALIWCGLGILDGTLSYGTLTAILYLVGQIQQPFASISSYISQYYGFCTSAERLMKLDLLPREGELPGMAGQTRERPKDAAEPEKRKAVRDAGKPGWKPSDFTGICAEGLSFSYGRLPVFADAGLCLMRGEFAAFTGKSGIGKSTLFKLLLALYRPDGGKLFIRTGEGGKIPVSPQTREMFAYVPQGNFLLSGTIWECVRFLPETAEISQIEREKIRAACRIACADEFILEMPKQYETLVGERGLGLSEGQAQRLAIARALYADSQVLLLDESTSALDEATEAQVLENIRRLTDKTVLIVTHRRRALSVCDRIIRIENGRFVEEVKDEAGKGSAEE